MSLTRRLARPALASIFISSGIQTLRQPDYIVAQTRAAGLSEPELLTQVHAATNLAGGLALATGFFPRTAAFGLAMGLVPTTVVGHPFWSADAEQRQMQQINFMKNLSMFGGLLIAAIDKGDRKSLAERVGRSSGNKTTRKAKKAAAKTALKAGSKAAKAGTRAQVKAAQAASSAGRTAGAVSDTATTATRRAGRRLSAST